MSFDLIVCADWSKDPAKRAVWTAEPATKEIRRVEPMLGEPWTVARILENTTRLVGSTGSALVSFDAPIGVPASYLAAARALFGAPAGAGFLEWLPLAAASQEFWRPVHRAEDWSLQRPFFKPKGEGSLGKFEQAAKAVGAQLRRRVERQSRGNAVFAFGLPGQVAPAAQALWLELLEVRKRPGGVVIWPFEGPLDIREHGGIVVAEIYPRAAYGTALSAELPARARSLSKTHTSTRTAAIDELQSSRWLADCGVLIDDVSWAQEGEDDFDACMTAAALLRLTLEGLPLSFSEPDWISEGGMLGA